MHVSIEPNFAQFVIMLIGRNVLNDSNILLFFVFFSSILLSVQANEKTSDQLFFIVCFFFVSAD